DTSYVIRTMLPSQLIEVFHDSIASALLPLHPQYCQLQLCSLLHIPYGEGLSAIKHASDARWGNRFGLYDIIIEDPLFGGHLTLMELSYTMGDSLPIDWVAFMETICGSQVHVVE